jgi:hypothetical protein
LPPVTLYVASAQAIAGRTQAPASFHSPADLLESTKGNEMQVDTNEYVRSHMHAPRGRGAWAFRFDNANDNQSPDDKVVWFAPGLLTYTEARTAARREAIVRRARRIAVLP